jgi:hypothetical protein
VLDAEIAAEDDDRLLAVGIAAFPASAGIGIGPVHVGDDDIGPIETGHVRDKDLRGSLGALLVLLWQPHLVAALAKAAPARC